MQRDSINDLYESLLGSRLVDGELHIPNFSAADYESLWEYVMEVLVIPVLNGRDYYHWLGMQARRYYRQRGGWDRDLYDPLTQNRPEELTTRQQLAIIKYYLKRRRYSMV